MLDVRLAALLLVALATAHPAAGDATVLSGPQLLEARCGACHGGVEPKGGYRVASLGEGPDRANSDLWRKSLEYVRAGFMPPAEADPLPDADRRRLIAFLAREIGGADELAGSAVESRAAATEQPRTRQ